MKTTCYYNSKGEVIKKINGEPRSTEVFLRYAADAARIDIATFVGGGYFSKSFTLCDGRWVGEVFKTMEGSYSREVLDTSRATVKCVRERVSQEEAEFVFAGEAACVLPEAREAIRWCNPEGENDENGRYWLNAYAGADVYRLIVKDGRIVGSIPGGLHGSRRVRCSSDAWVRALHKAIEERVEGTYHLLKADGSGTYFYLRNEEDAQYINVKKYNVPSIHGGTQLNIEVL